MLKSHAWNDSSPAGFSDRDQLQPMRAGRPSAPRIKGHVDAVLKKLSPLFAELNADDGRASIPPDQLLTALYRVRSERLFCEQLGYNLPYLSE